MMISSFLARAEIKYNDLKVINMVHHCWAASLVSCSTKTCFSFEIGQRSKVRISLFNTAHSYLWYCYTNKVCSEISFCSLPFDLKKNPVSLVRSL